MRAALLFLAAILSACFSPAWAGPADLFEANYAPSGETSAQGANRLVGGILSYARWPDSKSAANRTICVIGTPRLTTALSPRTLGGDRPRTLVRSAAEVQIDAACDALYLGRMPVADRQKIIAWVRNRPILTITDDDPTCSLGAMFCLVQRVKDLGFSINLDSIARSHMRVDPRVLRIGREGNA